MARKLAGWLCNRMADLCLFEAMSNGLRPDGWSKHFGAYKKWSDRARRFA